MKFKVRGKVFQSLESASAAASNYFNRTGIVVAVEAVPQKKVKNGKV